MTVACRSVSRYWLVCFPLRGLFYANNGIYEIRGRVGSEILTSKPCGVLPEKETVPRWAFTICTTSFKPRPCSVFSSQPWVLAMPSPRFNKVNELINLLHSFGVQAVMDLKPEQLGAFATAMRELGAKI